MLDLIRSYSAEGVTPPDPDRVLASTAALPTDDALIWQRAVVLGDVAVETAVSHAHAATAEQRGQAAGLRVGESERAAEIARQETALQRSHDDQQRFDQHLAPLVYADGSRREAVRYYLSQILLGCADVGSIAASAVNVLGDPLPLAIIQGLGVGVANVTIGQLGAITRQRAERARRSEAPPPGCEAFSSWFGEDDGERHDSIALAVGGVAVGLTFLGQFALRAVFDGAPIGVVYAAFAVVVVAGSFVNSFIHGGLDEVQHYNKRLHGECAKSRARVEELQRPDAEAAALTTAADEHRAAILAQGAATAAIARAEALSLMIAQPSMFGTHHGPAVRVADEQPQRPIPRPEVAAIQRNGIHP